MSRSFARVLRDRICEHEAGLRVLFGFSIAIGLLLLVSLTVVERGSATFVIVIIDLVSVGIIGTVTAGILVTCRRGRED